MAVAPLGTALTEDQLALLWRMAPEPTLCFDGDAAGLKAAYRALDLALPLLKPGHSLKFALLPEGQDPDDLLKAEGPDAVKAVVEAAQPLSEVLWQRALAENDRATPERKAQFERDLRNLINQIGDEVVKKHYLADVQERLRGLFGQKAKGDWRVAYRGQRTARHSPFATRHSPNVQALGHPPAAVAPAPRPQCFRNVGIGTARTHDPAGRHQPSRAAARMSRRGLDARIHLARA